MTNNHGTPAGIPRLSQLSWYRTVEGSIHAIAFADLDGRLDYVNAAWLRMWGYEDPDEVLHRHVSTFGQSSELTQRILTDIANNGQWIGETVALRKDGETFVVEMSGTLIRDAAGAPIGMMGSFVDITERREAEAALRDSEELYRLLVESALDPIFTCDANGRYLYVNQAAAATFGKAPEDITGKTVYDLFPSHLATKYHAGVRRVIESGETLISEELSEINGQPAWFSNILQPTRNRHGRVTVVQGVVRDITRIKRAEEALRESEERLRQAVGVANIGIFDHDHRTDITYLSPEQRTIYGSSKETLSGSILRSVDGKLPAYLELTHPDDRERVAAAMREAHRPGDGLFDVEFRVQRDDGRVRWVAVRAQTIFEREGDALRPIRTIGACRDITEQKQAEEERKQLQLQLLQAQKMESVGRLAGGVAHDFNNMLNVIGGYAELALNRVEPAEPLHAELLEIRKAAQHSADLTRRLLAFARKQPVAPKVLNLNDLVEGALKMLRRLIGEDITPIWIPGRELWSVRIDPTQVDQVLANLATNARDAILGVGEITLRTQNVVLDATYCARHAGSVPGEYVMLEVADNGRGMDQETQEHIFEPFYTTKAEGLGTGLGLAMVYGIVKQNEGFITVSSEVGQGTTVSIFLRRAVEPATVQAEPAVAAPKSGNETVLLVEDEPLVLGLSTRILQQLGYRVLGAGTPHEAIRLADERAGEIQLLVTDVVMPAMNGRELCRRLVGQYPGLKCLLVSGYPRGLIDPHNVVNENIPLLQKPFSAKDLATKVREVLEKT